MKRDLLTLYVGFAARYLTSFISLPFLARQLHPAGLGTLVIVTSLATFVGLWVEFGFSISGLREIAAATSQQTRSKAFFGIFAAKSALILLAAPIVIAMISIFPQIPDAPKFSIFILGLGSIQGLNLSWYFQAVGRAYIGAAIDAATQLSWVIVAICLVHAPSDLAIVLVAQLSFQASGVVVAHWIAVRQLPFIRPDRAAILNLVKLGLPLFSMRVGVAAYTTASVLVVGTLGGPAQAGIYNAAERFVGVIIAAFGPAAQIFMPHLVKVKSSSGTDMMLKAARKILALLLLGSCLVTLLVHLSSGALIDLFAGARFHPASSVLSLLGCTLPFVAISQVLGLYVLVAMKMDRSVSFGVLLGGLVSLATGLWFVPTFGALGMASGRVLAEATIAIVFAIQLNSRGLLIPLLSGKLLHSQEKVV